MSEYNSRRGKREAPGGGFSIGSLWGRYRAWAAGLDRGGRIRLRLCQVLAVIAILAAGVTLYLRSWIRLPNVPDPPEPSGVHISGNTSSSSAPNVEYTEAELPDVMRSGRREGCYTFLLAGRDVVSGATDTMILVTYDTKNQKVNAISLLRDTMVNTSARRGAQKRLNVVLARNMRDRSLPEKERVEQGMTALKQEVSRLTGIYPDFYVLVEWEAIGSLVEALGGVEFEVPFDMDYDDPVQDLHIHQKAGLRLLNGRDAMEVIRFRKNNNNTHLLGDSGRTQIQRDFLTATLKKCLTPEIVLKLPSLAQIFMDNVTTDLTVGNILAFAQLAVGMDVESGVKFVPMPYDNTSYQGAALALVRQDEMLELLNDGINPYLDQIGADDLQLMYRKSGGGYGVTNGVLADASVGRASTGSSSPKPSGETAGGGSGGESTGGVESDVRTEEPPDIVTIDPSDIFPDAGEEPDPQAAA